MGTQKARQIWFINVVSFVLFSVLACTGLVNWLLLPRGAGIGGGILAGLRHLMLTIHELAAVLFIVVIGLHLLLHRSYIKARLGR